MLNKDKIIESLKQGKPRNIKISNKITKDALIESLLEYESTDAPSVIDLEKEVREGGVGTLPTIKKEEGSDNKSFQIKMGKNNKDEKKTKTPIKFATDLGMKTIIFDENFMGIDEQGKASISDMFKEEEVNLILKSPIAKWRMVEIRPIYCIEKYLMTGTTGNRITCYNPKLNKFKSPNLKGFVNALYERMDDKGKEPVELEGKKLKSGKTIKYKFIPIESTIDNLEIGVMQVARNKYAIALQKPNQEHPYLFNMTPDVLNFFFKDR